MSSRSWSSLNCATASAPLSPSTAAATPMFSSMRAGNRYLSKLILTDAQKYATSNGPGDVSPQLLWHCTKRGGSFSPIPPIQTVFWLVKLQLHAARCTGHILGQLLLIAWHVLLLSLFFLYRFVCLYGVYPSLSFSTLLFFSECICLLRLALTTQFTNFYDSTRQIYLYFCTHVRKFSLWSQSDRLFRCILLCTGRMGV